LITLKELS